MNFEPTEKQTDAEQVRARQLSLDQDQPPTTVPGYRLHRVLGSGAYGQVWVGMDETTGREVAVKFFFHRSGVDWSLLSQEVEKLVFMSSDRYVVQLLDVGWDADPPYYVMEYLEQGSLEDHLDRHGPMPLEEAVEMATDLAIGLVHAHSKGVFHCDLKPANILLDNDDKPRLADFGQSRLSHEQTPALGTLFYMAPEQADLEAIPDGRWDVYALGALLHAMLTGKAPWRDQGTVDEIEEAANLAERLERYRAFIETQGPPSRHLQQHGLDRSLLEILDRCLAVDPDQRYANPQQVLSALRARQRARARRPLILLGIGVPLFLLIGMVVLFSHLYSHAVEEAEVAVLNRAYQNNRWVALYVANSVEHEIETFYEIVQKAVETVEEEAKGEQLQQCLQRVLEIDDLHQLQGRVHADEERAAARDRFIADPVRGVLVEHLYDSLQRYIAKFKKNPREPNLASMFVVDSSGTMLAVTYADPALASASEGKNYCWRTYFHGYPEDLVRDLALEEVNPIAGTHFSTAFKSTTTKKWKVAISTPVKGMVEGQQKTIGVMAITVNLGDFSTLSIPALESENLGNQKVVFLDGRNGVILQHPDLELAQQESEETLRVDPKTLEGLLRSQKNEPTLYVDPVYDFLNPEQRGARWIVSTELVEVPGADKSSNLIVLVQENHDEATRPVVELGQSLRLEGAIALVILVTVVLGMGWLVVKQ
jgi:serine/threonine protein kinase